jgi:hypothetical protein
MAGGGLSISARPMLRDKLISVLFWISLVALFVICIVGVYVSRIQCEEQTSDEIQVII